MPRRSFGEGRRDEPLHKLAFGCSFSAGQYIMWTAPPVPPTGRLLIVAQSGEFAGNPVSKGDPVTVAIPSMPHTEPIMSWLSGRSGFV